MGGQALASLVTRQHACFAKEAAGGIYLCFLSTLQGRTKEAQGPGVRGRRRQDPSAMTPIGINWQTL